MKDGKKGRCTTPIASVAYSIQIFRILSSQSEMTHSSAGEGSLMPFDTTLSVISGSWEGLGKKKSSSVPPSFALVCVKSQWLAGSLQTVLCSHLLMARMLNWEITSHGRL